MTLSPQQQALVNWTCVDRVIVNNNAATNHIICTEYCNYTKDFCKFLSISLQSYLVSQAFFLLDNIFSSSQNCRFDRVNFLLVPIKLFCYLLVIILNNLEMTKRMRTILQVKRF